MKNVPHKFYFYLLIQLISKIAINIISWIGNIHDSELRNGSKSFNQNEIEGEMEIIPCSSYIILVGPVVFSSDVLHLL